MLDNDDGDDDDGTCLQPVASSTNSILLPMARPRNKFYLLTYLLAITRRIGLADIQYTEPRKRKQTVLLFVIITITIIIILIQSRCQISSMYDDGYH